VFFRHKPILLSFLVIKYSRVIQRLILTCAAGIIGLRSNYQNHSTSKLQILPIQYVFFLNSHNHEYSVFGVQALQESSHTGSPVSFGVQALPESSHSRWPVSSAVQTLQVSGLSGSPVSLGVQSLQVTCLSNVLSVQESCISRSP